MPDGTTDRPSTEASHAATRTERDAAYEAWFRAEVETALKEADDPDTVWVSNEDVERDFAEQRARWRLRAAAGH